MSESVLLTTDGPSLQFPDEKKQSKFELGVACAVFLWDDLATAVASGWGGPESAEKREWLAGAIVKLFDAQEVATEDVEYRLLAAMIDEFDVTIETGSALPIAQRIIKIYQECADNKYDGVQELFQKFQERQPAKQVTAQNENGVNDDNEEFDDDEEEDEEMGKAGAVPKLSCEPEVNEDGFTIVCRK